MARSQQTFSTTPPIQVYKFKKEDEFLFGKVSYYNEAGHYGFIFDNISKETVYFNDDLAGIALRLDPKIKYKYIRSKQGNQISAVEPM